MTESKHTPGPWINEYCGKDTIKIFKTSDKRRIATIKVKTYAMDEANARLIASAPELLEALEAMLERYASHGSGRADMREPEQARKAIAKATGEEPPDLEHPDADSLELIGSFITWLEDSLTEDERPQGLIDDAKAHYEKATA